MCGQVLEQQVPRQAHLVRKKHGMGYIAYMGLPHTKMGLCNNRQPGGLSRASQIGMAASSLSL